MKKETRGRKCTITPELTERIVEFIRQGCDQKTACNLAGIPYSCYNEWKQKGSEGREPYASFFSVTSRARDEHKHVLVKHVLAGARGLLPRPADWKAAAWLLEKGWPLEFGDRRPLPMPQDDEEAPVGLPMFAILPSGNIAPVSEIMEAARQWQQKARSPERRGNEQHVEHVVEPELDEPVVKSRSSVCKMPCRTVKSTR